MAATTMLSTQTRPSHASHFLLGRDVRMCVAPRSLHRARPNLRTASSVFFTRRRRPIPMKRVGTMKTGKPTVGDDFMCAVNQRTDP
jgi:hypothetical protein